MDESDNIKIKNLSLNDLLFVNTSAINILLPLLLVVFIRTIPQANHIIFNQLLDDNALMSTCLIFLYTFFAQLLYYKQATNYINQSDSSLSWAYSLANKIFILIPGAIWLLTLLFNCTWKFVVAILLSLLLLGSEIAILFFNAHMTKALSVIHRLKTSFKYNELINLSMFIVLILWLYGMSVYNEILPELGDYLFLVLLWVLFLCILIYLIRKGKKSTKVQSINIFRLVFKDSGYSLYVYSFLTGLLLIILQVFYGDKSNIFTPLNILLISVLMIRIGTYLIMLLVLWIKGKMMVTPVRPFYMIFISLLVIFLFSYLLSHRSRHQHIIQSVERMYDRIPIESYVDQWLNQNDTTSARPIYLISGQGGGSRAGSVFFTSISLLDSLIGPDVLGITTISGSGNGAKFYLNLKRNNSVKDDFFSFENLDSINYILYQRDYISQSLFKILFGDYFRSFYSKNSDKKVRNQALIQEEDIAYTELITRYGTSPDSVPLMDLPWNIAYCTTTKINKGKIPLFFPVTYDVQRSIKAISSPVVLPDSFMHDYYDILGSLDSLHRRDLTINASVALSEMFPILSASATIDTFKNNFMDGGVYDNLSFETLFDLYRLVSFRRNKIAPNRPIVLISIENSPYMDNISGHSTEVYADVKASWSSAVNSIFNSNPYVHKREGLKTLDKAKKDQFFELRVYETHPTSNKRFKIFRYMPDDDEVVMSRYLTKYEIDSVIVPIAKERVDSIKNILVQKFY